MPRELGYKDTDDHVIVINPKAFGEHGVVISNDGFGEVLVKLDSGRTFHGYEARDFIYEDEELPSKPIEVEPAEAFVNQPEVVVTEEGQVGILDVYTEGEVID